MNLTNVEIKARCEELDRIRDLLKEAGADYKGTDHQIDTYFRVAEGQLKLRQGTIENNLIYYHRPDRKDPKRSDVQLVSLVNPREMKSLLAEAIGIKIEIRKKREIYFIDNVKFHLDEVEELGRFVEIEAIDRDGSRDEEALRRQCRNYMTEFGIDKEDLISHSYSDMKRNLKNR
ncbi:MAG: class IV adenylate cyclase [Balneolaceae bacterium]|nr:class IV adenylate cyclase [Balneolaceae bacterium]